MRQLIWVIMSLFGSIFSSHPRRLLQKIFGQIDRWKSMPIQVVWEMAFIVISILSSLVFIVTTHVIFYSVPIDDLEVIFLRVVSVVFLEFKWLELVRLWVDISSWGVEHIWLTQVRKLEIFGINNMSQRFERLAFGTQALLHFNVEKVVQVVNKEFLERIDFKDQRIERCLQLQI